MAVSQNGHGAAERGCPLPGPSLVAVIKVLLSSSSYILTQDKRREMFLATATHPSRRPRGRAANCPPVEDDPPPPHPVLKD